MEYVNSNLSNSDAFRMLGTLPADRIEQLLDKDVNLSLLDNIDSEVKEGMCFPEEDFLSEVLDDMGKLLKNLRGNNRNELAEIIEKLSMIADSTNSNTEYGIEKLKSVITTLEQVIY